MSDVVDVILVGVGNRGRWAVECCRPEAGWRVVGLVDTEPRFLEEAGAALGVGAEAWFRDVAEALERVPARAMVVCSPTVTHAPYARLALDVGVAVLVEKGMAPTWEDARSLVAHARRTGGVLAVAQNYRYRGLEEVVREALQKPDCGHFTGPAYLIDYTEHRVRPEPRTLSYPFASVWDMSCHHFDNLLAWLGPVTAVTAQAYRAPWTRYAHPANTSAFLRFSSGTVVNYCHTHDAARAALRIEVHGERGALVARDGAVEWSARPNVQFGTSPAVPVAVPARHSERAVLADFRAYVTEGREPGISGQRNLETMALCEMTCRSATLGREVRREELDAEGA